MQIKKRLVILAAAVAGLMALAALPARAADNFPNKPIQLVIPFAPGDTDSMLRPFVDKMAEFLGQPVVLNYKPGAGGGVGAGFVANSKPDGYTLVGTTPGSIVVVPLANKDVKYTPESFMPIASMSEGGMMLVVNSSSPWKSIKELVEYSKKNPEAITFSSSGAMGITHLLAEIFANEANVKWRHIPYQGSGPAITALLGGHVAMATTAIAPAAAHMMAGTLRPLALFGDKRLKAFPDVPTLKELGYSVGSPTLYGISAPKGTPREVVDAIFAAAKKVNDKYGDSIAGSLAVLGAETRLLGPDDYAAYLQSQKKLFGAGIKAINN
jgi:tripartite-type tricarboxylate transporter receptor subunit TctC